MKLKFINLLLASSLCVGAAQVLTSCKDNENDLWVNVDDLDKRIKANEDLLAGLEKPVKNYIDALQNQLDGTGSASGKSLQEQITDINGEIGNLTKDLENAATQKEVDDINDKITDLESKLSQCTCQDVATKADIKILEDVLAKITGVDYANINDMEFSLTTLKNALDQLTNKVDAIVIPDIPSLDALNNFMNTWEPKLGTIEKNAADAWAKAQANEALITTLRADLANYATNDALDAAKKALEGQIAAILAKLPEYATVEALNTAVSTLRQEADANLAAAKTYADTQDAATKKAIEDELNPKIKANADAISEINTALTTLTKRVDELAERISGVVLHQAVSPAFGTFNIPVGITNKLMVAYVGTCDTPTPFPITSAEGVQLFQSGGYISADEAAALGVKVEDQVGLLADRLTDGAHKGEIILGDMYVTLNPHNVNPNNLNYALVNSRGENLNINVDLYPSDDELMLGYSRSEANGFYQAVASIDESKVNNVRFTLTQSFKDEVKEVLQHPRANANLKTIATLAGLAYKQVDGVLPALAIQATWDEPSNGKTLSVNSEYNMGVATVNPLSFRTMDLLGDKLSGVHDKYVNLIDRLPDISSIPNRFKVWFDNLTSDIKIDLGKVDFKIDAPNIKIEVSDITVTVPTVGDNMNKTITVKFHKEIRDPNTGDLIDTVDFNETYEINIADDLNKVLADMKIDLEKSLNQVVGEIEGVGTDLNKQIGDLVNSINNQVNDLFSSMSTNINGQISDILGDIQHNIHGKLQTLQNLIARFHLQGIQNRMETVLNLIGNVMDDPLHYSQPILLYKNGGNFGMLSANPAMPSAMNVNGGQGAITLVPTTYTLETVVPCYLKYVAVVKAVKNGVNDANEVKAANGQYLNSIEPGSRFTMPLQLKAGYNYEIVYQAMDYSGEVMGRRYYVTVK